MKTSVKAAALCTALCLTAPLLRVPAQAAPPRPAVDETAYVNLDFYGQVENLSVVKAVSLNGSSTFTDYGEYSAVQNMSNRAEPKLDASGVQWELDDTGERFYYSCTPGAPGAIELPWSFDVSYRLNGAPKKAEELAGVSGMVSIDVEAIPDETVNEYFQDNMVLVAGMLVNTADVYSFSAPGAQLQTIGANQAAVYLATPGQHTTFHFSVGSDSFETMGVFMAMVPATLSQLDEAGDIRDDKENVKEAAKALDRTMDIILDSLDKLPAGLRATQSGLNELNEARQSLYAAKDGLYGSSDEMRASMAGLSAELRKLAADVADSRDISRLSSSFDDAADALSGIQNQLEDVRRSLQRLDRYFTRLSSAGQEDAQEIIEKIQQEIAVLQGLIDRLGGAAQSAGLQRLLEQLERQLRDLQATVGSSNSGVDTSTLSGITKIIAGMLNELHNMTSSISGTIAEGGRLIDGMDGLDDFTDSLSKILRKSEGTLKETAKTLDSVSAFVKQAEDTLKSCEDQLNSGMKKTLEGLSGFLGDAAEGLEQTGELRENKDIITGVVKDQWNKMEGDFGLLDINTGADKVSFTSPRNPPPNSIQIVLRTAEIEIGGDGPPESDLETEDEDIGVVNRVKNIFVRIWDSITGIFKKK